MSWLARLLKRLFLLIGGVALLIGALAVWFAESNRDLDELTRARMAAAPSIGVAIEAYRARHGHYPETLDSLIPEFLAEIPEIMRPGPRDDRVKEIRYEPQKDDALLSWNAHRGPDARITYSTRTGRLARNP